MTAMKGFVLSEGISNLAVAISDFRRMFQVFAVL